MYATLGLAELNTNDMQITAEIRFPHTTRHEQHAAPSSSLASSAVFSLEPDNDLQSSLLGACQLARCLTVGVHQEPHGIASHVKTMYTLYIYTHIFTHMNLFTHIHMFTCRLDVLSQNSISMLCLTHPQLPQQLEEPQGCGNLKLPAYARYCISRACTHRIRSVARGMFVIYSRYGNSRMLSAS